MQELEEARRYSQPPAQRKTKVVRRRFAQVRNGDVLGEEITEEELGD